MGIHYACQQKDETLPVSPHPFRRVHQRFEMILLHLKLLAKEATVRAYWPLARVARER